MFGRIGRATTSHARLILLAAGAAVVLAALLGIHATSKLKSAGFVSPSAPSKLASDQLKAQFGGSPDVVLLVTAKQGTVDQPDVAALGRATAARLAGQPGVIAVTSYWTGGGASLRSRDGSQALVVGDITGSDSQVDSRARHLIKAFSSEQGPATVRVGGSAATNTAVGTQIGKDLGIAEGVAIPLTLILMIFAFGSVVAALLPIAIGMTAIVGTLASLWALGSLTDVSIYALNLTTAMGLGLAIDYSLLMVNRYREGLAGGLTVAEAVVRSVETAGRTIFFSALTVMAAMAALLVFPVYFLRSFAYAGISVIIIAAVGALVILPALLTVLGARVNAWRVPIGRGQGTLTGAESPFWRRFATGVMRRPLAAGLPVVILLIGAGLPFLHVHFGTPDDRVLPTSAPVRQVGDALRTRFAGSADNTIDVVTTRPVPASLAAGYSRTLSDLPGVTQVAGPAGVWAAGQQLPATPAVIARHQASGASWFSAEISPDPLSGAAAHLVHEVRALPAPGGTKAYVGGAAASLVDQKHDLGSRLPLALILIVLTTLIVLWLFTGSVVMPLKALVLNVLSLSAVFGLLVWVFQYGHGSSILGFTALPTSTTMPLLLFCIAFGLSMDYEVFLLSRIKELHDRGAPNVEAVTGGLARTGRLVTTAAALLAVTFFAFGTSKVSFIQMFGVGTGVAILVDATLIRGILVPAFMRLMGEANWWSPGPLRRLHDRMGLAESAPVMKQAPAPAPAPAVSSPAG